MKIQQKAIGMDKIVIRIPNTFISIEKATSVLFQIFGYHQEDLQIFYKPNQTCYFNKRTGTDFKISTNLIIIEFHGTFCALYGWEVFKILKNKLQEAFQSFARITEIHIAQDFINLSITDLFKHPQLVSRFMAHRSEVVNIKTKEVETIYLRSLNSRWNLTIYDKTNELRKNIFKSSPDKIEHYRKRGYLDSKVTRVELKLHSDYCKKFIETFESKKPEKEICEAILSFWYKRHKIYSLKKSQSFDEKHPERHQIWPLWKKLFAKKQKLLESKLPDDALLKNLHKTDIDKVAKKIINNSLKYDVNPHRLISEILGHKIHLMKASDDAIERIKETHDYLQTLLSKKAS